MDDASTITRGLSYLITHFFARAQVSNNCDGFRMPAHSLSFPHARRPLGRRSKAASERNRGIGARLSAGAMGICLARPVQRGAGRRASGLIVEGRHGRGVRLGVVFCG